MDVPEHYTVALERLQPVVRELLAAYGGGWAAVGTLVLAWDEALRRESAALRRDGEGGEC